MYVFTPKKFYKVQVVQNPYRAALRGKKEVRVYTLLNSTLIQQLN